jgi:hypothetical protein
MFALGYFLGMGHGDAASLVYASLPGADTAISEEQVGEFIRPGREMLQIFIAAITELEQQGNPNNAN